MKTFPRRRRLLGIGLAFGVLGFSALATLTIGTTRARSLRAELAQVQREMDGGRFALARGSLSDLARRRPWDGEVLLLLGRCEEALGRPERALAAWEQVRPPDPSHARAVAARGALLINLGRYAPAESLLLKALGEASAGDRYAVLQAIARLFRLEGRFIEVSEVLIAAWATAPNASALLQDLWQNDTEPVPVDGWKLFLDAADGRDDRVWLGRARLALLTGRFDEADVWLRRCLDRRPDDSAVWSACLDLAVATEDRAKLWEAAERIPADVFPPGDLSVLRSWLASRGGDRQAEKREWARLLALQPSNSRALEHLAVLAVEAGDPREAERLQRRKAEVDRARDYLRKLIVRAIDFRPHARELVRESAVLGRRFDENAWLVVASSSSPSQSSRETGMERSPGAGSGVEKSRSYCRTVSDAALARLAARQRVARSSGPGVMADRLADLRGALAPGDVAITARRDPEGTTRPRPYFVDRAEASGLRFAFDNGKSPMWLLPESLSGGVGLVDFDGDGWLDVYCVQGGSLAAADPSSGAPARSLEELEPGDRLFRNQRDGTFHDVTRRSGIDRLAWGRGYGLGVAVGDYDNDGHPDLLITRLRRYDLYRNRGDGTFEDATERSGLGGERSNPTSAVFADLDGDGDLDLYVCHYVRWDPGHPPLCKNERWGYYYCDPANYESAADHVFRNDRGRFVDVTERAGFTDAEGRGLGVLAADLDGDNRVDLYVANDGTANFLFHNRGGFQFEDVGLTAGAAGNAEGAFRAGMGIAAGDLDGDGRLDLLVTNLYGEGVTLYHNLGEGMFADRSAASGILQATRYFTGFGIAVFDAANDGLPDVAIANGHVNDFRPLYPFAMPSRLYEGGPGGRFIDVSDRSGPPWSVPRLGRGLASGDLDNDGRIDFLVMAQDGPLAYFHNQSERAGHFVTFRLEGTDSNRDGVGARVAIATPGRRQVAQRLGGGSYLSACDGRLHFGLGASTRVESVEVRWPSGRRDLWKNLAADTGYLLREGDPAPLPLAGFSRTLGAADRSPR